MKVVIIGGVAGGATAAARLRRLNEQAEIIVFERSGYVSYANCGLPYYVGGTITDRRRLTLQTPTSFKRRFNIDVRVNSEVTEILRKEKAVRVRTKDGTEYTETYDKLIYSPGAKAIRPKFAVDDRRIFTLRTVEDTYQLDDFIRENHPKTAVIAGGGFIGLEAAENLVQRGISVTVLQRGKQVMPPFDYDMACIMHSHIKEQGVDLRLSNPVSSLESTAEGIVVNIENEPSLKADMVLIALGVTPETNLAEQAGLQLGIKKAVVTDEHMLTSDPDIYAVGDAVQVRNIVSGEDTLMALAGPANKQGRIAADNICGIPTMYTGVQGSLVLKLFELTAAATGLNEKAAIAAGRSVGSVLLFSPNHATYYPGASNITLKVLYDRNNGKILGGQAIGYEGVDKRIDVLAVAIRAGMTAQQLSELDLSYAPPYSSAKDPVNMAGYVIGNIMNGIMHQHDWNDMPLLLKRNDVTILDVQTRPEFEEMHFKNAINIPLDELRQRMDELDKGKPVYVNCYSGLRSYIACRILAGNGFECSNFAGGIRFYALVHEQTKVENSPRYLCGLRYED